MNCRLPVGETADFQSALPWRKTLPLEFLFSKKFSWPIKRANNPKMSRVHGTSTPPARHAASAWMKLRTFSSTNDDETYVYFYKQPENDEETRQRSGLSTSAPRSPSATMESK
jgi:hypothetical protein